MKKINLSTSLRKIAKEYSDYEDEVDSVFVTVLNNDGSIRMIPYDCENDTFDNSPKTVCYLGNGILKDSELVGLASELAYAKKYNSEDYNNLVHILENQTKFDNYDTLIGLIDDISEGKTDLDLSEEETEDDDDKNTINLVQ